MKAPARPGFELAMLLTKTPALDEARLFSSAKALSLPLTRIENADPPTYSLMGGASLIVMPVAARHPDALDLPPIVTGPARKALEACQAHVIITALGLEGEPMDRDVQLAALTACVVRATDAVGAMLASGRAFHRADVFAEMADHAVSSGALPAEIAVDVTSAREDATRMSFLTHGLRRYGREEFYVTCPIQGRGAVDFIYGLVEWMLNDRAKVLPTGDTVGRTEDEKVKIQRVPSPTGSGDVVIRLDLP